MPDYDRQVIVQLDFDPTITKNAKALNAYSNDKGLPSVLVPVRPAVGREGFNPLDIAKLTQELKKLTRNSRVYLQAHGNWQMQHLSSYNADQVAELLINCGLSTVKMISILGCESGRDLGTSNNVRVANSMDSFGSNFHRALRDKGGLKIDVFARIYLVAIGNPIDQVGSLHLHGHKFTYNKTDNWDGYGKGQGSQRTRSKLRFFWVGNTQSRVWDY